MIHSPHAIPTNFFESITHEYFYYLNLPSRYYSIPHNQCRKWLPEKQQIKSWRKGPQHNDDNLHHGDGDENKGFSFGPTDDITCFRLSWPGTIFHLIISIRCFPLRFLSLSVLYFVFWFLFCISNPLNSWPGSTILLFASDVFKSDLLTLYNFNVLVGFSKWLLT